MEQVNNALSRLEDEISQGSASERFSQLDLALIDVLTTTPVSEYELIKKLQQAPYCIFAESQLTDPLDLFQVHFILFNRLYNLKKTFNESNQLDLEIHTLGIKLVILANISSNNQSPKPNEGPVALITKNQLYSDETQAQQKLSEYYLNWENFNAASSAQVEELLTTFWRRYSRQESSIRNSKDTEAIKWALRILKVSKEEWKAASQELKVQTRLIKMAYKKQANKSHPDKGGSTERFKEVTKAYHILINIV